MKNVRSTNIDSLKERENLYLLIRKRIDSLVKEEEKTGNMDPELRESISVANSLLREIRVESYNYKEDPDEMKNRVFGEWMAKIDGKGKVKTESEGTE